MLKINYADGSTSAYDLEIEEDFERWTTDSIKRSNEIRGMAVLYNKMLHTLPINRSVGSSAIPFAGLIRKDDHGEILAEKIGLNIGDIEIALIVYRTMTPKMARIDVQRIGKQRFDPVIIKHGENDAAH